jgi:hypothetical protein
VPSFRHIKQRIADEVTEHHSTIGFIPKPVRHVLEGFDPASIRWLPELPDGHLASPSGLPAPDGGWTVLAERVDGDGHARVVAFDLDMAGRMSEPREVLPLPGRACSPHLIAHGRDVYCIVAAPEFGGVQLFRADPFPDRWVPDSLLLADFPATAVTVFMHAGRWWLFAGRTDEEDAPALYVFHSPALRGPWQAHALNPIGQDRGGTRPAGTVFTHLGGLFRPAQGERCEDGGGVISIQRVLALTPTEFREEPVTRLAPEAEGAYPDGFYTLSGMGNVTLVDGRRRVRTMRSLAAGLWRLTRPRV